MGNDLNNRPYERPRLMHIYLTSGRPELVFGYPSAIAQMMWMQYGDDSLKAVRVLKFMKPTEVTRYEAQSSWSSTLG